jgi:hypothetical protein
VAELRGRQAHLGGLIEDLEAALDAPPHTPPVHAHLRHRAVPIDTAVGQYGRAVRVWSAASASILLVVLGVMLMRDGITTAAALLLAGVMIVIEAILRRRVGGIVAGILVIGVALGAATHVFDRVRGDLADWVGALLIVFAIYLATQTVREAIRAR